MKTVEDKYREALSKMREAATELEATRTRKMEGNGKGVAFLLDGLEEAADPLRLVGFRLGVPVFEDTSQENRLVFQDGNFVPDDEAAAEAENQRLFAPAKKSEAEQDARLAAAEPERLALREAELEKAREAGRRA